MAGADVVDPANGSATRVADRSCAYYRATRRHLVFRCGNGQSQLYELASAKFIDFRAVSDARGYAEAIVWREPGAPDAPRAWMVTPVLP